MAYSTYNPQLEEIANSGGIGAFLKGIAPAALGIAGNLIAPGIGGMIGSSVGGMVQQLEQGGQLPLNEFNGLLHEQGGININAAEVEGGETSVKDYVFSDNLMIPGTKRTFAQESKRIEDRYKRRPYDRHATKSKERELKLLIQQQQLKLKAEEQAASNPIAQGQETMSPEGMPMMNDGGLMAAGYGLQALTSFLPQIIGGTKELDPVNYGRVSAPNVDYSPAINLLKNKSVSDRNQLQRMAGRSSNQGQFFNAMGNYKDYALEEMSKVLMNQENQRALLGFEADKINLNAKMAETEANQKNKDAQTSMRHKAFADLGQVAATGIPDYMSNKMMKEQINLSNKNLNWLMGTEPSTGNLLIDNYKITDLNLAGRELNPNLKTFTPKPSSYSLPEGNYPAPTIGSLVFTTDGKFIRQADGSLVPAMKCGGKLPKRSYRRKK